VSEQTWLKKPKEQVAATAGRFGPGQAEPLSPPICPPLFSGSLVTAEDAC